MSSPSKHFITNFITHYFPIHHYKRNANTFLYWQRNVCKINTTLPLHWNFIPPLAWLYNSISKIGQQELNVHIISETKYMKGRILQEVLELDLPKNIKNISCNKPTLKTGFETPWRRHCALSTLSSHWSFPNGMFSVNTKLIWEALFPWRDSKIKKKRCIFVS